jgi:glycine dehydrogenase
MVEPTESENKYELDRFCDAMIAIRDEIEAVHKGDVSLAGSMLRNAPHTALDIAGGGWDHDYERAAAAFPVGVEAADKYWPPVGRIDGAYGDRHLICSCPPPEAFEN